MEVNLATFKFSCGVFRKTRQSTGDSQNFGGETANKALQHASWGRGVQWTEINISRPTT